MSKITINQVEYETDLFSDKAMALLNSVRVIEASLLKLNDEVKVYNTAKRSYVSSLLIEIEESSDAKGDKTRGKAAPKKTKSTAKSKK